METVVVYRRGAKAIQVAGRDYRIRRSIRVEKSGESMRQKSKWVAYIL